MLTVLFAPLDYHGHVNPCSGLAQALRDRGHRVVFAIDKAFQSKLETLGLQVECTSSNEGAGVDTVSEFVVNNMDIFEQGALVMAEKFQLVGFDIMHSTLVEKDSQYRDIIARVRPDLIVIDSYVGSPTLTNCGVPFVWLYSAAPLMALNKEYMPPPWSGLPLNGDRNEWNKWREELDHLYDKMGVHQKINDWYRREGAPPLPDCRFVTHPLSKHLNVYMWPKELDYQELQPLPDNWLRVDGFVRSTNESFSIPESLRDRPGKLVFLSMGSMGCSHIRLMTRLVAILAKSRHRFIVSKGPLADRYALADNMWGTAFVAQTAVLPMVDLVVTHGGNNTVTESFFFGKPMLVMPLFGDQFDNAQRIQETGLGLRLSPFHCSEEELLSSVDRLVDDRQLRHRMSAIGHRIRQSDDKRVVAQLFEQIVEQNKTKQQNRLE